MRHPCISPTSYSPWLQFHSHVLGITPCIGYVKHAHPQHLKVIKHFVYPIWMWDAVNGGLQPQPWHRNIIIQAQPYPHCS
jgi:hypothetical protein